MKVLYPHPHTHSLDGSPDTLSFHSSSQRGFSAAAKRDDVSIGFPCLTVWGLGINWNKVRYTGSFYDSYQRLASWVVGLEFWHAPLQIDTVTPTTPVSNYQNREHVHTSFNSISLLYPGCHRSEEFLELTSSWGYPSKKVAGNQSHPGSTLDSRTLLPVDDSFHHVEKTWPYLTTWPSHFSAKSGSFMTLKSFLIMVPECSWIQELIASACW